MGNVLISALTENIGGVEEYVLNLSRYQGSHEHTYSYILIGNHSPYENEMKEKQIPYFNVFPKKQLIKSLTTWHTVLKEQRKTNDTLYINTSSLGFILPYLMAYRLGYKLILHSHSDASTTSSLIKKIIHKLNYRILRGKLKNKFACSTPAAKWMFGNDYKEAHLIPNAINLERFRFDQNKRIEMRQKLGYKPDDFVIGNVGRLTEYKNQKFLLEIIKRIKDQRVKLLLVGDGEDRKMLEDFCHKWNLDNRVKFYGRTKTPEEIMNAMDCIVMPSIAEGFPVSLVEEQSAGLTCFVSDIITREVNVTGDVYFLPINNIDDWVDHLNEFHTKHIADRSLISNDNIVKLRKAGFDVSTIEARVWKLISENY